MVAMDKLNHLDEIPIADLKPEQLSRLQFAEEAINETTNTEVYLIALEKNEK
jgi:hypothetical protein